MIPYGRSWATGGDWPLIARSQLEPLREQLAATSTGLLLCGDAGIGKTQLAHALRDSQPLPVVGFACSPGGAGIPLMALNRLLDSSGNLLPDSRESAEQRVRDHLAAVSDGGAALVLGDDVQWLDDASAAVLETLVRSGDVRLLCTTRTTRGLAAPLRRLLADHLVHRVDVVGMSAEEVVLLLERLLSGPVDQPLAEELVRVTGGNALFLREAVRSALAQGSIALQDGVWVSSGWSLPTGIGMAELVDRELEQIEPEQREVVELIALGQPITVAEVVSTLGHSARASVKALAHDGLLTSEGRPKERSLRISHPVYAERIRRRTPARRRRSLHERRYADADISSMAPGDFLRWTTWAVASGLPIASEHLLRAAYSASSLGQDRFALRMAESALARLDEDALLERADALLLCSWQRLMVGDWQGGYAGAKELVELLGSAQTDVPREEVVLRLLGAHRVRADIEQFVLDDVDAALATMDHFLATIPEGAALYDRALGRARRLAWAGDATELRVLLPLLESDDPPTPDLLELVAPAINHLTWGGDIDRALAISDRHWAAAETYTAVLPWLLAEIHTSTMHTLLHSGRLEELEGHPRLELEKDARRDHTMNRIGHAYHLHARGQRDEAWRGMESGMRGLEARDPSGLRTWASAMAADLARTAGKWSAARRHFDLADLGRTGLSRGLEPDARLHLCRAAIGLERADAATRAEDLASWAAERGYDLVRLDALHLLGVVDVQRLRELLSASAPLPPASTAVMQALADHVRAVLNGDDVAARDAEAALTTYGRRNPMRGRALQLTPREREIADLAGAGLTSSEIANRLDVSARTVEGHVSRVVAKLGVSSRGEIAQRCAREPVSSR